MAVPLRENQQGLKLPLPPAQIRVKTETSETAFDVSLQPLRKKLFLDKPY